MWLFLMFIRLSIDLECEDGVETVDFYSILADVMDLEFPENLRKLGKQNWMKVCHFLIWAIVLR